jgi:hypothetical protein
MILENGELETAKVHYYCIRKARNHKTIFFSTLKLGKKPSMHTKA